MELLCKSFQHVTCITVSRYAAEDLFPAQTVFDQHGPGKPFAQYTWKHYRSLYTIQREKASHVTCIQHITMILLSSTFVTISIQCEVLSGKKKKNPIFTQFRLSSCYVQSMCSEMLKDLDKICLKYRPAFLVQWLYYIE